MKEISDTGTTWLARYRDALRQHGWTPQTLYRRNRPQGLLWYGPWHYGPQTLITQATVAGDGIITFELAVINNMGETIRTFRQTARP